MTHLELTRTWIADLSSVIHVSGEISEYLDSLEDAWRIYLNDVTFKLDEEINTISELEDTLAGTQRGRGKEIRSKLSEDVKTGFGFRLFRKKTAGDENMKFAPGLKNKLNEIKNQRAEISDILLGKQAIKKVGERWRVLSGKLCSY